MKGSTPSEVSGQGRIAKNLLFRVLPSAFYPCLAGRIGATI
ncbi:unnamed protein product [Acidithrix sp. C25]|nr:unnamed protein product [Acidithrix sp. C25]